MTTIDDYNVQHLLTAVVAKLGSMFGPEFINDVELLYEAFNTPDGPSLPHEESVASSLHPPGSAQSGRDDAEDSTERHHAIPGEDLNERPSHD